MIRAFLLSLFVTLNLGVAGAAELLKGGDISQLHYLESLGAKFYESGKEKDPVAILGDNGFNMVRLRAYNDPGNPAFFPSRQMPPGYQNSVDILSLAKGAGAKGMKVQLTLNYSDWWADGLLQDVPHEWVGMTVPQIRRALYDYTFNIVSKLTAQGTPPEMVSLEIVPYPETPEGQQDFLRDFIKVCRSVEKGRCLGFTYWDPISVNQPGFGWIVGGKNEVENYTLFDYSHNALPALTRAFKEGR